MNTPIDNLTAASASLRGPGKPNLVSPSNVKGQSPCKWGFGARVCDKAQRNSRRKMTNYKVKFDRI